MINVCIEIYESHMRNMDGVIILEISDNLVIIRDSVRLFPSMISRDTLFTDLNVFYYISYL